MPLNPYAANLGSRNAREVISETPQRLRQLIERLGARANQAPAPGKWSAREIACHLADCEVVFAFRLRQAIAEDGHVVQPFDQDKWAKNYSAYDAAPALTVFSALRKWNITFLSTVAEEQLQKKFTHPERGEMTFRVLVETMAGHDLNHLKQVEAISAKQAAGSK
jgi:hypothetical protein